MQNGDVFFSPVEVRSKITRRANGMIPVSAVSQQSTQDVCETYSFVVKNVAVVRDESCGNNSAQIEEVNESINKLKAQSQVDREMRHR